jgi:hypothetical protein
MAEKSVKTGKTRRIIPLRQAGVTVVDANERPSKALFDEVARQEAEQTQATPPTPPTPPTPSELNKSVQTSVKRTSLSTTDVAPSRDFQKVANSIVREAVPSGVFKGKSKLIYDCLYLLTRGAIIPKRSVRIPKRDLMKRSGIGSERTLLKNLLHLRTVSLLVITEHEGQHEGNEYEVFLPEEIGLDLEDMTPPTPPTPPTPRHARQSLQKVGRVPTAESGVGGVGSSPIKSELSAISKTYLKDLEISDDDMRAIALSIENLNEACRKVTGKNLTSKDLRKLSEELSEIIISETILASLRAKSVSAFVPFLIENLRRCLYSTSKSAAKGKTESRRSHLEIGKGTDQPAVDEQLSSWTPQTPLTEEQRDNTLIALEEAKANNSILYREFKTYGEIEYTTEDFNWLLEKLEKQN